VKLSLTIASPNDAGQIVDLRNQAAWHLTAAYGKGHWSYRTSEKEVLNGMTGNPMTTGSKTLIAKLDNGIAGTLRLTTRKPWAIDPVYFTKAALPLYLVDMTVHSDLQHKGVGKYMLQEVKSFARSWPAQAIRLDAYDTKAGAGDFYRKCGFTERGRIVYGKVPLIYFELVITGTENSQAK